MGNAHWCCGYCHIKGYWLRVNSLSVALRAGYLSVRTAEGASEKQSSLKARLRNGLTYLLLTMTNIGEGIYEQEKTGGWKWSNGERNFSFKRYLYKNNCTSRNLDRNDAGWRTKEGQSTVRWRTSYEQTCIKSCDSQSKSRVHYPEVRVQVWIHNPKVLVYIHYPEIRVH